LAGQGVVAAIGAACVRHGMAVAVAAGALLAALGAAGAGGSEAEEGEREA